MIPLPVQPSKPPDSPSTPLETLSGSPVFQGVAPGALQALASAVHFKNLAPGEVLLVEGEEDDNLYIVHSGRLSVRRKVGDGTHEETLAHVEVGDPIGEMKLFGRYTSSATVLAAEASVLIAIPLEDIRTSPHLAPHREALGWAIGHLLSERLNNASSVAVEALHSELNHAKARIYSGRMLLFIVILMGSNSLILASLRAANPDSLPSTSVISFVMITVAAAFMALALRGSPYPREALGLTFRNAWLHTKEAIVLTAPILLGLLALKIFLMSTTTLYEGHPLFDPAALFQGGPFVLPHFLAAVVGYSIHAPLQEFVTRGGLQGTLNQLLEARGPFPSLLPILISNLMFASFHSHLGVGFALAAFFPGLFWGWLFSRQGGLVGPVVSHILLGVWAIFVLGLQAAF